MYSLVSPTPSLRPYIECYWFVRTVAAPQTALRESIFVDGRADLIFNFGDAYQRQTPTTNATVPTSNLDAQRDHPVAILQIGNIHLVGVRFRVGGLAAFLPMQMHDLSNLIIDPHDGFSGAYATLEGQLYDARADLAAQTALLDAFFLRRINPHPSHALAFTVAQTIVASGGETRMTDAANAVGYSIRTVDRQFQRFFGMSPKFYARVVRLERALGTLLHDASVSLAQVAHDCGYYDQSHFSREFAALTGQSPSDYRAHLRARAVDQTPNLVQFLQDDPK